MKLVIVCMLLTTLHLGSAINVEGDLKFANFLVGNFILNIKEYADRVNYFML